MVHLQQIKYINIIYNTPVYYKDNIMTAEQFAYWLQGFSEMSDSPDLNEKQWRIVQDHLQLVFNKVTPDRTIDFSNIDLQKPCILNDPFVSYCY